MSRELRSTFDAAAASYQDARPAYPEQLYADLLTITGLRPPAHLLEVGCGPGNATLPLARRGFRITAVELGVALAEQARQNLAGFPGVAVVTAEFEEWRPDTRYDLVYAATAWHWLDPAVAFPKAASLLRGGGYLAVWGAGHACPVGFDPFFTEIQSVYDEIGESRPNEVWPPAPPELTPNHTATAVQESGCFEVVAERRYLWALRYTADEYLALLDTFSGHIAMAPDKRAHLYAEIRHRLNERPDGTLTRHWTCILTVSEPR